MDPSPLQKQIDEFETRNLWFQMLLGLVAIDDRLTALFEAHAPVRERAGGRGDAGSVGTSTSSPDDALIDAMLGVVALRQQLRRELVRAGADERSPVDPQPPSESLRDLLR